MRTTIFGLLIWIFICTVGELNANELENPGFDDGIYWSQVISPWVVSPGNPGWSWEFSFRKNGRWAVFISSNDTLTQRVAVTPFTDYLITVPLASGGGATWYQNIVHLYVDDEEIYSVLTTLKDDFKYYSASFNSGNRDTVVVRLNVWAGSGNGCVRIDDPILTPQPDTVRPVILSATAYDGEVQLPGIDDDDYVVIAFSEPTNTPRIWTNNIDEVFHILSGHTWLSSEGRLWSTNWNERGDTLRIDLYVVTGDPPTIEVGDQFHADLYTITDESGNPVYRGLVPITIGGSFYGGLVGPKVTANEPFEQGIDARIKFSEDAIDTKCYIYEPR